MKFIGEVLLYLIGLPIFAFQTVEGLEALGQVFAEMWQGIHKE